jgi:hypothetical protein
MNVELLAFDPAADSPVMSTETAAIVSAVASAVAAVAAWAAVARGEGARRSENVRKWGE